MMSAHIDTLQSPTLLRHLRVHSNGGVQLEVPILQAAPGSFVIASGIEKFENWSTENHKSSFSILQRIASHWNGRDFLLYGHIDRAKEEPFSWEVVPYEKTSHLLSRFWQQIKVVYRLFFSALYLGEAAREEQRQQSQPIAHMQDLSDEGCSPDLGTNATKGTDPFCLPEKINNQLVKETEKIHLLYNYAPQGVGETKLHFLFTPKVHRQKISELTREEYAEMMQLTAFVIDKLSQEFPHISDIYLYGKEGKDAGQTVDHAHLHLVATLGQSNDWISKLRLVENMVLAPSPLSPSELREQVSRFSTMFSNP